MLKTDLNLWRKTFLLNLKIRSESVFRALLTQSFLSIYAEYENPRQYTLWQACSLTENVQRLRLVKVHLHFPNFDGRVFLYSSPQLLVLRRITVGHMSLDCIVWLVNFTDVNNCDDWFKTKSPLLIVEEKMIKGQVRGWYDWWRNCYGLSVIFFPSVSLFPCKITLSHYRLVCSDVITHKDSSHIYASDDVITHKLISWMLSFKRKRRKNGGKKVCLVINCSNSGLVL